MTIDLQEMILETQLRHPIECDRPHKIVRMTRKTGRTQYIIFLDESKRRLWEYAIKKGIKFRVILIPEPSQE